MIMMLGSCIVQILFPLKWHKAYDYIGRGEGRFFFPFSNDVEAASAIEVVRLQLIYFSSMELSGLFKKKNVVKYYFYIDDISRNLFSAHLSR